MSSEGGMNENFENKWGLRGNSPIYRQKISRIPNDVTFSLSWDAMCGEKKKKKKKQNKTKQKMSYFMARPQKG